MLPKFLCRFELLLEDVAVEVLDHLGGDDAVEHGEDGWLVRFHPAATNGVVLGNISK